MFGCPQAPASLGCQSIAEAWSPSVCSRARRSSRRADGQPAVLHERFRLFVSSAAEARGAAGPRRQDKLGLRHDMASGGQVERNSLKHGSKHKRLAPKDLGTGAAVPVPSACSPLQPLWPLSAALPDRWYSQPGPSHQSGFPRPARQLLWTRGSHSYHRLAVVGSVSWHKGLLGKTCRQAGSTTEGQTTSNGV